MQKHSDKLPLRKNTFLKMIAAPITRTNAYGLSSSCFHILRRLLPPQSLRHELPVANDFL